MAQGGIIDRNRLAEAFIRGFEAGAERPGDAGDGDAMYQAFRDWTEADSDGSASVEPMDIHTWFGLTYSNYLVSPRSVLQSMPEEWQHRFVAMLREMEEAYGHLPWSGYEVRCRDREGRYMRDPIPHYNRGRTYIARGDES